MHALSVKQPWAEMIARGEKEHEFRTWGPRVLEGRDLLVVASRSAPHPHVAHHAIGLPRGVAICVVRVTAIEGEPGDYAWELADPRRVAPIPLRGSAALFHVDDARITYVAAPASTARQRAVRRAEPGPRASAPFTFQDGDRKLKVAPAATMTEARRTARELADRLGDYVYIMRDGVTVGGEWHAAKRG